MWDLLFYLLVIAFLAVLVVMAGVVARSYLTGTSPTVSFFGPKPDPRIFVTEQANVDGRRKLLLIRRDDVEHLIMTGGPVDVVIESGINARQGFVSPVTPSGSTVAFERGPRSFGQKASDG
jgi:flagellar protein FliO/FliZ